MTAPLAAPLTASEAPQHAPSGLRLLPAPSSTPPYDDELPAAPVLRLVPSPASPAARPAPRPRLALVPDAPLALDPLLDPRPGRTPSTQLPAPRAFAQALLQRAIEVRAGLRPVSQLQRDTTPELYADLETRLSAMPRTTGPRPTRGDVRSLHVQQRPDGVAEVCATVRRGSRMRALALRLEGQRGRWVCTELAWV